MNHICLHAHAKINLALDVLSKRPDGYHEVKMIMQTLHLHDTLFIKKTDESSIKLISNCKWLPNDERNLACKAAKLLTERYHLKKGVFMELTKNIPVSAGLGGGSADCAATLLGLRALFDLPISDDELSAIGKELGADVPYCLLSGTALACGIGEKLTPLPNHPITIVVLVKPPVRVSTADVFSRFSLDKVSCRPNIDEMISHINNQRTDQLAEGFCNVLESVTEVMHPVITAIKRHMLSSHAMGALMSGSGPSVFGYFRNKNDALSAVKLIKKEIPAIRNIYLTSTYNPNEPLTAYKKLQTWR